jgi:hypothetical protein
VIDESSSSSGTTNNWVRGRAERDSVKAMVQLSCLLRFRDGDFFSSSTVLLWGRGLRA